MIHNITIDDSTPTGKKLIEELRRHTKTVKFEKPTIEEENLNDYMSGEEFWKVVRSDLKTLYKDHGLLQ